MTSSPLATTASVSGTTGTTGTTGATETTCTGHTDPAHPDQGTQTSADTRPVDDPAHEQTTDPDTGGTHRA